MKREIATLVRHLARLGPAPREPDASTETSAPNGTNAG
jgi:hypothetical protein